MAAANSSWLARRVQDAIHAGLSSAYNNVKVDPGKYLEHLRRAYGLPVQSFAEMHSVPLPVVDYVSENTIRASMKFGLAEGAGLGLGGVFSILPDMGILSAITIRLIQKLSLIHGFEYATDEEVADLWIATASAAGVDIGKELIEKQLLERFVPRVIERVAVKAGSEVTEKLAARMVPLLSAALGGTLNYYFLRSWGIRAQRHFRERALLSRRHLGLGASGTISTGQTLELPSHSPTTARQQE
jgi:EcsC protein family